MRVPGRYLPVNTSRRTTGIHKYRGKSLVEHMSYHVRIEAPTSGSPLRLISVGHSCVRADVIGSLVI